MRTHRLALLAAAAALFLPLAASAADLPVSYTVEEKPLKAAIAGTSLSFELYGDNTCTTLVQTVPVLVESVSLLTKLKQMTPKGDTKLPKTVELRTTLTGVTPATSLYAKVTGTGVVPVGGACQPQASAVAGPPGVAGLQGPAGPGSIIKDANGTAFGVPFYDTYSSQTNMLYSAGGVAVRMYAASTYLIGAECAYFAATGCTGSAAVSGNPDILGASSSVLGSTLYYANGPLISTAYQSLACNGPCIAASGTQSLQPAASVSLAGLVPPFHIEVQ